MEKKIKDIEKATKELQDQNRAFENVFENIFDDDFFENKSQVKSK